MHVCCGTLLQIEDKNMFESRPFMSVQKEETPRVAGVSSHLRLGRADDQETDDVADADSLA